LFFGYSGYKKKQLPLAVVLQTQGPNGLPTTNFLEVERPNAGVVRETPYINYSSPW